MHYPNGSNRWQWLTRIGFSLLVGGTTACSVLLGSSDGAQCSSDADCAGLGFGNYVCGSQGVCAAPPTQAVNPGDNNEAGGGGCNNNAECVSANGGRPALCDQSNVDSRVCRPIATERCEVTGNWEDPNALFIGWLHANGSPINGISSRNTNQVIMAHQEITSILPSGGIAGAPNGARRPLVLVSCDHGADARDLEVPIAKSNSAHLIDNVKVQATLALDTAGSTGFIEAAAERNRSEFLLCSNCFLNPRKKSAGQGDLANVFMGQPDISPEISGSALRVGELETLVRATPGFTGDVRIAVVRQASTGWDLAIDDATNKITFNGQPAASQPGNYLRVTFPDGETNLLPIAEQIAAFKPHIVIPGGEEEVIARALIPLIESRWQAGQVRPQYLAFSNLTGFGTEEMIGGNENLRLRVSGFAPSLPPTPDSARLDAFIADYESAFPGSTTSFSFGYESFYAVVYSLIGAGPPTNNGRLSAGDITNGLKKLQEGTEHYVGKTDLINGTAELLNVGKIKLTGLSYRLDYNFTTGALPGDADAWCVTRDAASGAAWIEYGTGQYYELASDSLVGSFSCP